MTDYAMIQYYTAPRRSVSRRQGRPGRPSGLLGAVNYGGVLLVWAGLFLINPPLALKVFRERRADSPIRREWRW